MLLYITGISLNVQLIESPCPHTVTHVTDIISFTDAIVDSLMFTSLHLCSDLGYDYMLCHIRKSVFSQIGVIEQYSGVLVSANHTRNQLTMECSKC